jgi:glycosyltransferase involved in cell wall biosynthesis
VPDASTTHAVVRAEAEGYDTTRERLMGRHSANLGFLRAAVAAHGARPIRGVAPLQSTAVSFERLLKTIDPMVGFEWIRTDQMTRVGGTGVLHVADSTVASSARQRQRYGLDAFSVCGVTHTTASSSVMQEIKGLMREPVAPWDALICTSQAVIDTVQLVLAAEGDYLRWRFGPQVRLPDPQLALIPLGVHCGDFEIPEPARAAARRELSLEPDVVTALFVGRLVFHAKAHPFAMYAGLQAAARRTGKKVALLMCGWAPNEPIAQSFRAGAAAFAPDVTTIFLDGRDPAQRDRAWNAADLFVSLSDSIQETFGLTPVEAMAAGLPVVVTDWNGYRDTVRDGVDGYRVKTWAPGPGMGEPLARGLDDRTVGYDRYCWATTCTTAVDLAQLGDALTRLVDDAALRRQLGEAGRRRARELFDWSVIYAQYQALWAELNARRSRAAEDPEWGPLLASAPHAPADALDPYYVFGHYPTAHITAETRLRLAPHATPESLKAHLDHPLFGQLLQSPDELQALVGLLANAELPVATAAQALRLAVPSTARAAGILAKMGMVLLSQ